MKIAVAMTTRVVFMGTPQFAVPTLETLVRSSYEVAAVYTQPDRKAQRGQQLSVPPVKIAALSLGLPVLQPENLKGNGSVDLLASLKPDIVVVAAYGHILPADMLALPRHGCVNIHPSLLPRYRGSSPIAAAVLNGDEVTGVTIMLLDAGMDSGPILSQRQVPVMPEDTTCSLAGKLAQVGASLLLETLPLWLEKKVEPSQQDESQATYTRALAKEDGKIDWHLPASTLWRQVRAFDPWPGCYTWWQGKRLRINQVIPLPHKGCDTPGKVIALSLPAPTPVAVETGDGILGLLRLQVEGKREMSAEEFLRGQREFIGSRLL